MALRLDEVSMGFRGIALLEELMRRRGGYAGDGC
jgi:hypothetical protein